MIFLVHDLIICGLIYLCYPYLPYILYSGLMGTAAMGLWVLGHECGHGAFGNSKIQNDLIGFILHSSLLVPYFSWKYTHNKHHKFTNHLIYGETHVPETAKEVGRYMGINKILGEDSFTMVVIFARLILGWPAYLFTNVSGGRTTFDLKTDLDKGGRLDHFTLSSQILAKDVKVTLSTIGCFITLILITYYNVFYEYFGPYLVVNVWLVLYIFLHLFFVYL